LISALIDTGDLVKITPVMVFTQDSVERAKQLIADAARSDHAFTTSRLREILGTSRKFAIPLLEYLDATGFTRRDGDVRVVR
jgi:selenocysteine-specific elongation factor